MLLQYGTGETGCSSLRYLLTDFTVVGDGQVTGQGDEEEALEGLHERFVPEA